MLLNVKTHTNAHTHKKKIIIREKLELTNSQNKLKYSWSLELTLREIALKLWGMGGIFINQQYLYYVNQYTANLL